MDDPVPGTLTSRMALERLMAGNRRYVNSEMIYPNQTIEWRRMLTEAQSPFAVILGCADSRVPPEIIFDQGLGDLFVVRVAGNIFDKLVLGSIEYAVEHLNTPLILVLGHSRCGAVQATAAGGELKGHMSSLASAIRPAIERVKGRPGDLIDNAAKANARLVAEQLKDSGYVSCPVWSRPGR